MYTIPEEFENATLFIPFTQVRRENGAFQKLSSNRRNLKTLVLSFSWDRILKTKLGCDNRDVCLPEFYSNRNPKCPVIVAWTENILWFEVGCGSS